jgi:hypothetical protein
VPIDWDDEECVDQIDGVQCWSETRKEWCSMELEPFLDILNDTRVLSEVVKRIEEYPGS